MCMHAEMRSRAQKSMHTGTQGKQGKGWRGELTNMVQGMNARTHCVGELKAGCIACSAVTLVTHMHQSNTLAEILLV